MTIRLFKVVTGVKLDILQVLLDCQMKIWTREPPNYSYICANSQGSEQEFKWLCSVTYFLSFSVSESDSDSQICQCENPGEAFKCEKVLSGVYHLRDHLNCRV